MTEEPRVGAQTSATKRWSGYLEDSILVSPVASAEQR
jgi:hypothetical protein